MTHLHKLDFIPLLAVGLTLGACSPEKGTHLHTDVPENHARIHQPDTPIDSEIEDGALAATEPEDDSGGSLIVAENILVACGIDRREAYFPYDSAKLRDGAEQLLEEVAACFEDGPMSEEALEITGHADPRGSDEYNRELGADRAESVADFLNREGVEAARLDTMSMGERFASDDPDQWRYDRKVVLELAS